MELIRRLIRSVLGPNSRIYRAGATTLDFLSTIRKDSIATWRAIRRIQNGHRGDAPQVIELKNLSSPIFLRPGTEDASTVLNNVIREEYGQFSPAAAPEWMIDAGAYIGDTSAYFLSRFPKLKVVALEPNPDSYEMAKRNLAPYGDRVILLQEGLYSADETKRFSGDGIGASIADSGFEVRCASISSILKRYAISRVDILKMDIEGAEEAIFSSSPGAWLRFVDWILVEIHGPGIQAVVSHALISNGFSMKRHRSVWYCRRGGA